jgi:FAD synthetase
MILIEVKAHKMLGSILVGNKNAKKMYSDECLSPSKLYNFNEAIESDEANYQSLTEDLQYLIGKIDRQNFLKKLRHSIDVVENCFKMSTPTNEICIAFNGGKDCCVVLYLYCVVGIKLGVLAAKKLNILFIELTKEFDELADFNRELFDVFYAKSYLNVIRVSNFQSKMKDSLHQFKSEQPNMSYILMGTRRGDSEYARKLNDFQDTDPDWPRFVRVNPILDWTYSELWYFIRRLKIPYCPLYDEGYTSLGDPNNTIKNKHLFNFDKNTYQSAYMLEDEHNERNSRI